VVNLDVVSAELPSVGGVHRAGGFAAASRAVLESSHALTARRRSCEILPHPPRLFVGVGLLRIRSGLRSLLRLREPVEGGSDVIGQVEAFTEQRSQFSSEAHRLGSEDVVKIGEALTVGSALVEGVLISAMLVEQAIHHR
jgi:hypothetical protein